MELTIKNNYTVDEINLINHCSHIAAKLHEGQKYGDLPYFVHCEAVARLAADKNLSARIVSACFLHDVIEDCEVPAEDLEKVHLVPSDVVALVSAVTDEPGPNRKERKRRTYPKIKAAGQEAIIVKLCDRIVNLMYNRIVGNQSLHQMYRKEHQEFKRSLYFNPTDRWGELAEIDVIEENLWSMLQAVI